MSREIITNRVLIYIAVRPIWQNPDLVFLSLIFSRKDAKKRIPETEVFSLRLCAFAGENQTGHYLPPTNLDANAGCHNQIVLFQTW